jgi:hypothetical protein
MYSESKVTKFNQGKSLNKMLEDGEISDMVHNWAKSGICAALTANWLKKERRYRNGANDKLMQKALGEHYAYKKIHAGSREELFSDVKLKDTSDVFLPILPNDADLGRRIGSWMRNDTRPDRGVYIAYNVTGRISGGHAVGARQHGANLDFFDPNCGWYKILPGLEEDFFRVYEIAYKDLGVILSNFELHPVD